MSEWVSEWDSREGCFSARTIPDSDAVEREKGPEEGAGKLGTLRRLTPAYAEAKGKELHGYHFPILRQHRKHAQRDSTTQHSVGNRTPAIAQHRTFLTARVFKAGTEGTRDLGQPSSPSPRLLDIQGLLTGWIHRAAH